MRVIAKPRQAGKTTELIKRSAETGFPIVCRNKRTADRIGEMARELKLPTPTMYTFFDAAHTFRRGFGINGPVLIDDADEFLQYILRFRIDTVTISTNMEDIE